MENFSHLNKFKRMSFKSYLVCPLLMCYEENLKPIILLSITSESDLIPLGTANPHSSGGIFAALSIGRPFFWNPSQVQVIAWKGRKAREGFLCLISSFTLPDLSFFLSGATNFSHRKQITGPSLRLSKKLRWIRPLRSDTGHCEEGQDQTGCQQYRHF